MKRIATLTLTVLLGSFLSSCKPPEGWTTTDGSNDKEMSLELEVRDGIAYEKGSTEPFNGVHLTPYKGGDKQKLKLSTSYVDGLKTGPEVHYRKNGMIEREYGYFEGTPRYVLVRYPETGLTKMISFYEDKTDPATEQWIGSHIRLHENGFPNTNGIWAADHKQWDKRYLQWDDNGQLIADYLFDSGTLKEIYFETEQQKEGRKERNRWNEQNLAAEQAAETEEPADQDQ